MLKSSQSINPIKFVSWQKNFHKVTFINHLTKIYIDIINVLKYKEKQNFMLNQKMLIKSNINARKIKWTKRIFMRFLPLAVFSIFLLFFFVLVLVVYTIWTYSCIPPHLTFIICIISTTYTTFFLLIQMLILKKIWKSNKLFAIAVSKLIKITWQVRHILQLFTLLFYI